MFFVKSNWTKGAHVGLYIGTVVCLPKHSIAIEDSSTRLRFSCLIPRLVPRITDLIVSTASLGARKVLRAFKLLIAAPTDMRKQEKNSFFFDMY